MSGVVIPALGRPDHSKVLDKPAARHGSTDISALLPPVSMIDEPGKTSPASPWDLRNNKRPSQVWNKSLEDKQIRDLEDDRTSRAPSLDHVITT